MWARAVERSLTNGADWMLTKSNENFQRSRSTLAMADRSDPNSRRGHVEPGAPAIFNQPDSLQSMESRLLIFLSFCALLVGGVWLAICVSLYVVGVDYHVMNVMYESRWLPCTVLFSGLAAAALAIWRNRTFFIGCGCAALYSCASCVVAVLVYSLNFRKALYLMHPPITSRMAAHPRRKYLQLCACMIIVALFGLILSILLLIKLWQIAHRHVGKLNLHHSQKGYLMLSAVIQLPLIGFSIYVTSHVISLPFSYVHQYMIQELLCALTLQSIIALQAIHYFRANRLTLLLLLILNGCQIIQEIFYTWNSYYISLYIHTSKAKLALGADADQFLMSVNFVGHFVRMCIAAHTTFQLSTWLQTPFVNSYCRLEMDRTARQAVIGLAAIALLLAASHVIMDVMYTITAHMYRSLIAFTGISVFYLTLIGVALALFVRSGYTLLLIIAAVFTLLLSAVSAHALYIYLDTSYHGALLSHFEALGKDKRASSYMHFAEGLLAMISLILCLIGGVFVFRLLHLDSSHDRRDGKLKKPLLCLFGLGIVQLELTAINAALVISVKDDARVFQSMLAYGVLDSMSMFVMCLTQIYVCKPSNTHFGYGLTALLLFLICETLTAYNYLSTKTTYVQLLIVFNQMFSANPSTKQSVSILFPTNEVGPMVAAHVVQLVQWILTIVSMTVAALSVEKLHEQRRETSAVASTVAPLPAVSYTVADRSTGNPGQRKNKTKLEKKTDEPHENAGDVSNGSAHSSYDNPLFNEALVDRNLELKESKYKPKTEDVECGELLQQENKSISDEKEELTRKNDERN